VHCEPELTCNSEVARIWWTPNWGTINPNEGDPWRRAGISPKSSSSKRFACSSTPASPARSSRQPGVRRNQLCKWQSGLRIRTHLQIFVTLVGILGIPLSSAAADPRYGDEILPETVQAQLRVLLPQRQGIVDTYALIIGGDAGDEVFRKETIAVRKALDGMLGTQGRSVVLLNHRSVLAPEATFNSLRQVLQAIGRQMNRDEDVLWLHVTSHGAADHSLVLSYPGRDLYWLTPAHLRRMLDEAQIRYRVIVVSACYSGDFVAALAGPETLFATASAASRQAYGCGKDSDITEFSKALYLNALPRTGSVLEAMHLAQQIIHEEENTRHAVHSYPQVRSGVAIETRLRDMSIAR
jgi:hypothetical protein